MYYNIVEIMKEEIKGLEFILKCLGDEKNDIGIALVARQTKRGVVYHGRPTSGDRKSRRLGDERCPEVIEIKQRAYDNELRRRVRNNLHMLKQEVKRLEGALLEYDSDEVDEALMLQYRDRTGLVRKSATARAFEGWEKMKFRKNSYPHTETTNVSSAGERVRSKSEIILYDQLRAAKVPTRYDAELKLRNDAGDIVKKTVDFQVVTPNGVLMLEHLGKLSDPDYFENALNKIRLYIQNGYVLNENLFLTADDATGKLNAYHTDQMIRKLILPRVFGERGI